MGNIWIWLVFALASAKAIAADPGSIRELSLDDWLKFEKGVSERKLEQNFQAPGAAEGAVIASPQQSGPNYFFHWVRDSALTMDVARREALLAADSPGRAHWEAYLRSYAAFSRANQLTQTLTGLGEPKFLVDGHAFNGPWARPQNDGPALRASTLIRFANTLLDRGETQYVHDLLYNATLPAATVIKADLEYVAAHWQEPCFDLWEETKADNFYTRLAQWKALEEGAALADRLDDSGAASWYQLQARNIANTLSDFLAADQVNSNINWQEGVDFKKSNLDISVILAVLHTKGGAWGYAEGHVQSTLAKLTARFASLYPINQRADVPGVALGRYPEDLYTGVDFAGGNPWVLATLAGAEYNYEMAKNQVQSNAGTRRGRVAAGKYFATGDAFLERMKFHSAADGSFAEQFDRTTGFMTSARDLTWSYAAFLTAYWSREQALAALKALY
jgi:glucoamylase